MRFRGDPLVCGGCGAVVPFTRPLPFRCREARGGDDIDHVLCRLHAPTGARWPEAEGERQPFARFGHLSYSWLIARRGGMSAEDYAALALALDERVAAVAGRGFRETPYRRVEELGAWIKDETGNVAGSHKGRHLFGVALYLEVAQRVGLVAPEAARAPLAIASCGNAALAAAVIALALERPLEVYLPTWADAGVVEELRALGATLVFCERRSDDPPGDPAYLRFVEALAKGAIPFTCQGNLNGLAIEGGRTLAWELALQHAATGAPPLDHLFVQVGGGALASATIHALRWAHELGALPRLPRLHAVQTESCAPLRRAWAAVAARALDDPWVRRESVPDLDDAFSLATFLRRFAGNRALENALRHAAYHRSAYMAPVAGEPKSLATGILDDETYDWLAVVRGMLETGGVPVVVSEERLAAARHEGRRASGIDVDATGAAGLAGAMALREAGVVTEGETVAVLFTGGGRATDPPGSSGS